jgi:hypothetical protein
MMRYTVLSFTLVQVLQLLAGEREQAYLEGKMIPLARQFLHRNGLPYGTNFGREKVVRFKVDFLTNRPLPFVMSSMGVENKYAFYFTDDNGLMEIRSFKDSSVETHYDLTSAPKEKRAAVRALNLRNKLNDKTALELATKYFFMQGHKQENFHPVEFRQKTWILEGAPGFHPLPFYEAAWFRKDVQQADRDAGLVRQPQVQIEVSGMTTNLISYSKLFMPVGSDFEDQDSKTKPGQ